ncbi:MAG TPA: AI-2E family transporter [Gammaproteobacteria bacterium]|nr:AI-2E family transporter [Gammaproteobacteria bacterium]
MVTKDDLYIDKLIRITLIAAIAAWAFMLIYPMLGILAWGFILAVVLYPFYSRLNSLFGNKPILASSIITLIVLIFVIGIAFFVTHDVAHTITNVTQHFHDNKQVIPSPPSFIKNLPLIGNNLQDLWVAASENFENLLSQYGDTIYSTGKYAAGKLINTSMNFIFFVIAILFSGFLLVHNGTIMTTIRKFATRVAPENGNDMITITRETIQNVCRGVIGISILQTLIFWGLLAIAKVPGAELLSLIALILCITQIGLFILIIPIVIWLFMAKSFGLALTMTILLSLDGLLDGFLKPFVLAHGLSTPTIIIFMGVIGGIIMYGLIGVFIGPVVLAIAYDLMRQWLR